MSIQTSPEEKLIHIVPPDLAHASSVAASGSEPKPQAAEQTESPETPSSSALERMTDFVMTHVGAPLLPWQTPQYRYVPERGNVHGRDASSPKRIWWVRRPKRIVPL